MNEADPEVPIFARAILVAHQQDALSYLDLRVDQFTAAGKTVEATFWSALKIEAERQIAAGEWTPRE